MRGPDPLRRAVLPPHVLRLVARGGEPLARQVLPDPRERLGGGMEDPLAEERHSAVPGLVRRYPDRALVLATTRCFCYCRFCTRRRNWGKPFDIREHWPAILGYLRGEAGIREVIVSGGDPLTLPDDRLLRLLADLRRIPHVRILRLASRVLTYAPERVTAPLAKRLGRFFPLYFMTHFNHPAELGPEARRTCRLLNRHGVILLNQSVLLRGVNDSAETLADLSYRLLESGVKPYALHLLDEVRGAAHFRVPLGRLRRILKDLRRDRTGLGIPLPVLDRPKGGGKVIPFL